MRNRVPIALLLIVLLPLGLLGWLGLRVADDERQLIEHRFQGLASARLKTVDDLVHAYFAARGQDLLRDAETLSVAAEALRAYLRREPGVRQVFLMDREGRRLHPPVSGPLSDAERRFLARTEDIWTDLDILYQSQDFDSRERNHGWYVWHWGAETNLIFWRRDEQDRLMGFELEPVGVLADLIARLPATAASDSPIDGERIVLTDARGATVYQWGNFEPGQGQPPMAVQPLSHPLGSWKLVFYAPVVPAGGAERRLLMLGALLVSGAALFGLAFFLYREHGREVRLAQQRVDFVNQVSHELKTPLTNIRMYAELLEDRMPEEDAKSRRYLDVIVAESQRLSRLIGNVLGFARVQKKRMRLHRRPGRVDEIVKKAIEAFRPVLASKGVQIHLSAQAAETVQLDPDVVEQILNNLLSNVEKYAAAGGFVEIEAFYEGERSIIRVRDHGPGIPKRERERIFRPFYRISSKLTDGVTGAGIGLAIARELACLHGGELVLLSADAGACFELSLWTGEER